MYLTKLENNINEPMFLQTMNSGNDTLLYVTYLNITLRKVLDIANMFMKMIAFKRLSLGP